MELPLYITLNKFKRNFKTYFSTVLQDVNYYSYLSSYKEFYENVLADYSYEKIILSDEFPPIAPIYISTYYDDQDISELPEDEDVSTSDKAEMIKGLFEKKFDERIFELFDVPTSLAIVDEIKKGSLKNTMDIIWEYRDEEETHQMQEIIKKIDEYGLGIERTKDEEEIVEKLSDELDKMSDARYDEINILKDRRDILSRDIKFKIELSKIAQKHKTQIQDIIDFIDRELEKEVDTKKYYTNPAIEVEEPLTTKQIEKVGLFIRSGIVQFLRDKNPELKDSDISKFIRELTSEYLENSEAIRPHLTTNLNSPKHPFYANGRKDSLDVILNKYKINPQSDT